MKLCSLNYIPIGSVELHFKWLKATYAIALDILRLVKLKPVWKYYMSSSPGFNPRAIVILA